jgi:hypothetical protein
VPVRETQYNDEHSQPGESNNRRSLEIHLLSKATI